MYNIDLSFEKRLNSAKKFDEITSYISNTDWVLDLGCGTGNIIKQLAADKNFKGYATGVDQSLPFTCIGSNNCHFIRMSIAEFLKNIGDASFSVIILSGIIHELDEKTLKAIKRFLPRIMDKNGCKIIIREPFITKELLSLSFEDYTKLTYNIHNAIPKEKAIEYYNTEKLSGKMPKEELLLYLNLAFAYSYGEESWNREKQELRYAKTLEWCMKFFNFKSFKYKNIINIPKFQEEYKEYFSNIGIEKENIEKILYTNMLTIIQY